MRLEAVAVGDIVKASIGGRIVYGEVLEVAGGVVRFVPLTRGSGWHHATAAQVLAHWRRAGRRRTGADGETVAQPPEQLALHIGS